MYNLSDYNYDLPDDLIVFWNTLIIHGVKNQKKIACSSASSRHPSAPSPVM